MKTIVYAGGTVVTGDEIAAAVLDIAKALAVAVDAETVDIPALQENGQVGLVALLIGPASQIIVRDAPARLDEVEDRALVESLKSRARSLHGTAQPDSEPPLAWPGDL